MLIVREAMAAIRRTPLLATITALVIAVSLTVIGIFSLLSVRASESLHDYRSKLPLEAYFEPSIPSDSAAIIAKNIIASLGDVAHSTFVSKEDALKEYTDYSGEDLTATVGYNPLPAGIRMTFVDLGTARAAAIITALKHTSGVKDILFDGKTLQILEARSMTLRSLAIWFGVFLLVISVAIAASLAQLSIRSRQETIKAMSLLGASRGTILVPYYIEAAIAGLLGGLLATAAITLIHEFALPQIAPELPIRSFVDSQIWLLLCTAGLLGTFLGFSGSVMTTIFMRLE